MTNFPPGTIEIKLTPITLANLLLIKGHIIDRINSHFGMNDVVLRIPANTQSSDEIIKKSVSEVTISTALLPGAELSYVIENIKNPDEVGPSSWEITTYLDTTIKDAKLNAEGFEVLVRIDVDTRESKADPRVYGAKESTIYFSMMSKHSRGSLLGDGKRSSEIQCIKNTTLGQILGFERASSW